MSLTPEQLDNLGSFPLQQPPLGVTPDFEHPASIAYKLYITAGVCISLMLVFTLIRIITWLRFDRKVYILDEIVYAIGLSLSIGLISMTTYEVYEPRGMFGKHMWETTIGQITKSQLVFAILNEALSPMPILFIKMSVLLLYLRVFNRFRWMRLACYICMGVFAAYHLSVAMAFCIMCLPSPSLGYDRYGMFMGFVSQQCVRSKVLVIAQGVGNTLLDIVLILLPLPAVWHLQMSFERKLKTSAMVLVGLCALIASIVGLVFRVLYEQENSDNTWLCVPSWAASMGEMAAGIIVCCVPSTAILFKKIKMPVMTWLSYSRHRFFHLSRRSSQSALIDSKCEAKRPSAPRLKTLPQASVFDCGDDWMARAGGHEAQAVSTVSSEDGHTRPLRIGATREFSVSNESL